MIPELLGLARWRGPVPNRTPGGTVDPLYGLVLHVEQGSEAGTSSWFHNPGSEVSAHFGAPRVGGLDQWVATTDRAWAEAAGNSRWLSVETEGENTQPMSSAQLRNVARLYEALHSYEPTWFPFRTSDSPTERGLGWHGMGGVAWGDHPDCPGKIRKGQRVTVLAQAIRLRHPYPAITPHRAKHPLTPAYPGPLRPGSHGDGVREASQHLHARGWRLPELRFFDDAMERVVLEFQAEKGLRVDGIIGPVTWWAIWHAPIS